MKRTELEAIGAVMTTYLVSREKAVEAVRYADVGLFLLDDPKTSHRFWNRIKFYLKK